MPAPVVALLILLSAARMHNVASGMHRPAPPAGSAEAHHATSDESRGFGDELVTVFRAGERNESGFSINTFRIPGFVVANDTLIAVAEARLYTYADLSPHHLVVKRSTTGGRT